MVIQWLLQGCGQRAVVVSGWLKQVVGHVVGDANGLDVDVDVDVVVVVVVVALGVGGFTNFN